MNGCWLLTKQVQAIRDKFDVDYACMENLMGGWVEGCNDQVSFRNDNVEHHLLPCLDRIGERCLINNSTCRSQLSCCGGMDSISS